MKKLLKNEDGQVVVLFALLLVVLLGFAALAIDVGMVALTKSRMQNAADAAALAGAQKLHISSSEAINTAIAYAGKNGMKATVNKEPFDGDTVDAETPYESQSNVIRVECTRNVSYTFARVLGFRNIDVSAHAIAVGNQKWGEALPFVNLDDNYNIGDIIELWEKTGPGDFESIFKDEYVIFNGGNHDDHSKTYFSLEFWDGIMLDKGTIATVKQEVGYIVDQNKPVYLWSLSNEVITSGKYYTPHLDPHTVVPLSDLVLLQVQIGYYDFNGTEPKLNLTVRNVYDVNKGEYPTAYLNTDKVTSKLLQ